MSIVHGQEGKNLAKITTGHTWQTEGGEDDQKLGWTIAVDD